jgi:hypothetical protein
LRREVSLLFARRRRRASIWHNELAGISVSSDLFESFFCGFLSLFRFFGHLNQFSAAAVADDLGCHAFLAAMDSKV